MSWDAALAGWAAWCRSAGHAEGTIRFRGYLLRQFAGEVVRPFEVTPADCVAFVGRPGLSAETRKFDRSALRSFYRWALGFGLIEADPTDRLPRVRIPETVPRPAPDDVFERAIANATDRDRLILMLGAYAGLRRAEIASLRWDEIDQDPNSCSAAAAIRVRGKGGRVRVVPVHPDLELELAGERARRDAGGFGTGYRYRPEGAGGPWLFPGGRSGAMTPDGLGKAAGRALGGLSAHTLRHRFATRVYAGTRDLLALQQLLGHSKPETTTRYARADAAALELAVAAAG